MEKCCIKSIYPYFHSVIHWNHVLYVFLQQKSQGKIKSAKKGAHLACQQFSLHSLIVRQIFVLGPKMKKTKEKTAGMQPAFLSLL